MSVAYLFPGQGSQHVGMGQDLYESEPASRAVFDQANEQLGFALSELCFSGPEEKLTDTVNQQPALFVTSLAAWHALKGRDWPPGDYLAGHSLGEFSALVAAGSLDFSAGLALVRRRGELMKAAGELEPGAMAAIIALDVETVEGICHQVEELIDRPVQIANDNCPGQIVISGDKEALVEATRLAEMAGARKVVRLPITIAAHSSLMASAAAEFSKAVDAAPIGRPSIPVIGNVSALPLTIPEDIRAELKSQLTSPVRWAESMSYLIRTDVDTFIEMGPGNVLLGLLKRIDRKTKRVKFENKKYDSD